MSSSRPSFVSRALICTHCSKSEAEMEAETGGRKLYNCSRCHRARYCSKECQKANWPSHKALCNMNSQTMDQMEQATTSMVAARAAAGPEGPPRSLDPTQLAEDLRRWIKRHKPVLSYSLGHALGLYKSTEKVLTHMVIFKVEPRSTPEKTTTARRFIITQVTVEPTDLFLSNPPDVPRQNMVNYDAALKALNSDVTKEHVMPFAVIKCGRLTHILSTWVPRNLPSLGITDFPEWEDCLKTQVEKGELV